MNVDSLFENSWIRKVILFCIRTEHHEIRLFTKIDLLPDLVVTFRHLGSRHFQTFREQGWRSGESARLPPMCPGFDYRTRRHMWAEFVGSLLCSERFFSGYSGFPLSSKTNI